MGLGNQSYLDHSGTAHYRPDYRVFCRTVEVIDGEEYGTQPERPGKRQFRAWRYYGIVDALRTLGVDQERAYELGKWAQQARDGDTETAMTLMDVEIKLRAVLK